MDIQLIKKLRDETNRGMLECKNALALNNEDYDQALTYLNQTYETKQVNFRVASKGLCRVVVKENEAILFEVNAETDFVSKNEHFLKLVNDLGQRLIDSDISNAKSALKLDFENTTIDDYIKKVSVTIQEKTLLRRFYRVMKTSDQSFGSYIHAGGKVVTLVILNQKNDKLARELAMQVAATAPHYLDISYIDLDTLNYEKFMFEKTNGYFEEKEFNDHLESITLLTQPYIYNDQQTVEAVLTEHHTEIIDFFRFELGQGIEDKLNCRLDIPCDGSKITVSPTYSK